MVAGTRGVMTVPKSPSVRTDGLSLKRGAELRMILYMLQRKQLLLDDLQ
jgi:hypothetical protein